MQAEEYFHEIEGSTFIDLRVDDYNPNKFVRLSDDLFNIKTAISVLANVHGLKVVYAMAQAIQNNQSEQIDGIPRINFSISALFDYLDLWKSNRRYEYLKMAFQALLDNPLHLVEKNPDGSTTYSGLSWISGYKFGTNKERVLITLNPLAIPFLFKLSRYASIQPRHYNSLSSAYQLWLYPFLKNRQGMGRFRVKVSELKILLNSESKSYNDAMRGTNSFFRRVLGIVPSSKAKEENIRARNAKEKPRFVPWDYAKDSTGKPMGTLYAINIHTDLFVYARGIKRGRSYEEVEFYFTSPDFFQKGKWKEELMYAPDLFAPTSSPSLPQIPDGTIEKKEGWGWVILTEEQVQEHLQTFGISNVEQLVQKCKSLQIDKEGSVLQYKKLPSR